jgi:putative peptide-modifying radical SAM enzyme
MLFFVFTTGQCNLNCKYCGGSFPEKLVPWEVKYPFNWLKDFVNQDGEPIIAFYGGEPLLNTNLIRLVMDVIPAKHYVVQTNGLLAKKLEPKYWMRMSTALFSIDGGREITDSYRGKGVYDRVIDSAKYLHKIGFKGDLVARMTATESSDIYRDVTHLLSLNLFNHIHWQLNVVWSEPWKDFEGWAAKSYNPGITRLIDLWMDNLRRGKILGIAPFLGIMRSMLFYEGSVPPCGAGRDAFAITTDGRIIACPIAVDAKEMELGHLGKCELSTLKNLMIIEEPCTSCEVFRYCGGRCLYAYKERYWGDEGFNKMCNVTKHLVNSLLGIREEIENQIEYESILRSELYYPPFNNTIEVIP